MHMRKKKWARPELAGCPYYAAFPEDKRGQWRKCFPAQPHLHLELGCGKGVGTAACALHNPDTGLVAVDISDDVLGDARRNAELAFGSRPVNNLFLAKLDISYIEHFFGPDDQVERIYLPFSNPWPRRRHAKRRLTHPRQLMQYRTFMAPEGEIYFKTDDLPFFQASLEYFEACGFETVYLTHDLHASGFTPNYVTEHEAHFSALGLPIHFGIFRMLPGTFVPDSMRFGMPDEDEPEEEDRSEAVDGAV